jgi:hypothetical protein
VNETEARSCFISALVLRDLSTVMCNLLLAWFFPVIGVVFPSGCTWTAGPTPLGGTGVLPVPHRLEGGATPILPLSADHVASSAVGNAPRI